MLSPGGLVTMGMMFVVGRLSGRIQPKYLIAAGAVIVALSMYDRTRVYAFWMLMLMSLAAVPLALALREVKLGGGTPMGH